jgi:predicted alpha/beta-fold hydrolase
LFDRAALSHARTIMDFDQAFTAPLHGFANVLDYWRRACAKPGLHSLRLPALVVNARNDPFVPNSSLPRLKDIAPDVQLWQPAQGGHVGFPVALRRAIWVLARGRYCSGSRSTGERTRRNT